MTKYCVWMFWIIRMRIEVKFWINQNGSLRVFLLFFLNCSKWCELIENQGTFTFGLNKELFSKNFGEWRSQFAKMISSMSNKQVFFREEGGSMYLEVKLTSWPCVLFICAKWLHTTLRYRIRFVVIFPPSYSSSLGLI